MFDSEAADGSNVIFRDCLKNYFVWRKIELLLLGKQTEVVKVEYFLNRLFKIYALASSKIGARQEFAEFLKNYVHEILGVNFISSYCDNFHVTFFWLLLLLWSQQRLSFSHYNLIQKISQQK